ncbi:MAG: tetratricopeptide repeat protein [Chitinophagaceae bacterium]|nr:MAG: tetratricopeptide repeat protein [Chitinophagaceae bacterium]
MRYLRVFATVPLLLILFPAVLTAQKVNEDSLLKIISSGMPDTIRIDAMLVLANYQVKHKMKGPEGLKTLEDARALSISNNYLPGQIQVLLTSGNYYRSKNEWGKSLTAYNEMLALAPQLKNDSLKNRSLMMAYNNLGGIYNYNGDFNNSLGNRLKALEIAERTTPGNFENLGIIYLNIASDYRQLKIPARALEYLGRTSPFFEKLSSRLKMEYYYEYHENYLAADSAKSAKQLLVKLEDGLREFDLSDFQKKDYSLMLSRLSGNYAATYDKNYAAAIGYHQAALATAKELGSGNEITESMYNIGKTYLEDKNPTQAISYLQPAYDSSVSGNLKNLQLKIVQSLADAYLAAGNTAEANVYLKKAVGLKTEIYDTEKSKEINFLEARYQNQLREKEITELQLAGAEKELTIVKRNRMLFVGGIAAACLLLVLTLLYRSTRQKKIIAEKEQLLQGEQIRFLERQQQVVSLQSMINGQETERTRIAKDLHDGLGGLFSTIRMNFSTLQHENQELKNYPLFNTSYDMVNTAAEEVRRIAHNMMPEVLIRIGLVPAVQELCNSISAGKLLTATMQSYGMDTRLNPSSEIMLYRIIQELLNNIIKHAQATEAIVQFNREGNHLNVTVEDNGRGFDTVNSGSKTQMGLESVKSRVNYLNGTLSIDSEKEIGTTVMMVFLVNE